MRVSPQRTAIATARLSAGLLQKEAADKCGVSISYFQKIELGKRRVPELVRIKIVAIATAKA